MSTYFAQYCVLTRFLQKGLSGFNFVSVLKIVKSKFLHRCTEVGFSFHYRGYSESTGKTGKSQNSYIECLKFFLQFVPDKN